MKISKLPLRQQLKQFTNLKENYDGKKPFPIVVDKALYIISIIEKLNLQSIPTIEMEQYCLSFIWDTMEIKILFDGSIECLYFCNKESNNNIEDFIKFKSNE